MSMLTSLRCRRSYSEKQIGMILLTRVSKFDERDRYIGHTETYKQFKSDQEVNSN